MGAYEEVCVICKAIIYRPYRFYSISWDCPNALKQENLIFSKMPCWKNKNARDRNLKKLKRGNSGSFDKNGISMYYIDNPSIRSYWVRRIKNGTVLNVYWHDPNVFHGGFVICHKCYLKNKRKCPVCKTSLIKRYK